jgi:hypothetical protein
MSVINRIESLDDVDAYVLKEIAKIKADVTDQYTEMEKNYRIASLLVSIAKNKDSIPFFEAAMSELVPQKNSFVWGDLYCSVAALYANTLDLVNDVEMANQVFAEVCTHKPDGCHIGDYAVFLHKRKKDNKKAER